MPLVLLNKAMRGAIGWLYIWKNTILIVTIVLSIIIYRPFCRYICPLGAFYSVFNKVSIYRYRVDMEKCVHCGKCAKACQMVVNPVENPNSPECIRCGRCKQACPVHAIASGIGAGQHAGLSVGGEPLGPAAGCGGQLPAEPRAGLQR